jgi:PAS domain-containing protein
MPRHVAEQQRLEELRRLADIAKQLNAAATVRDALRAVGDGARHLIGAHQAAASVGSEEAGGRSTAVFLLSDKYAAWRGYDEPFDGTGIYRLVGESLKPMRLTQAELEAHPGWRGFGAARHRHPPMRGWLAVPMIGGDGRYLGMLQLSDRYEDEFSAEDEALLVQLAEIAAGAFERLRQYEAARDAERRFREFAEIASDWLWETDAEHRLTFRTNPREGVAPTQGRLVGTRRWEVAGASAEDPLWKAHIAELDAHRPFRDFEYDVPLPGGGVRRVCTSGRPVFGPDGAFLGYRGAGRDITAQHRAE